MKTIFPSDRKHISHSGMNMLMKCGVQYDFRYNQGIIIPPNASLVRGKCGHQTFEKNFSQKIISKVDLQVDEIQDIFSDEWEEQKHQIAWGEKELDGRSVKKATGEFKDQGVKLVKVFHEEQSPLVKPVAVEHPFTVQFEGDYPDLVGVMDRIDEDDEIAEVKFVGKSPSKDDLINDIQMTIYSAGYLALHGRLPKKLKKQFAIATKEPKALILEAPGRDQETINRLMWRLQATFDVLKQGIFLPAPQGAWWCSEDWCGYWNRCKFRP